MSGEWIALAEREPPETAVAVFGWAVGMMLNADGAPSVWWEVSDDQPDCATHWFQLPNGPRSALFAAGERAKSRASQSEQMGEEG